MRISDWSSDVCSSDLPASRAATTATCRPGSWPSTAVIASDGNLLKPAARRLQEVRIGNRVKLVRPHRGIAPCVSPCRSEEHTSKLQSLMRLSYVILCMKKNKSRHIQLSHNTNNQNNNNNIH